MLISSVSPSLLKFDGVCVDLRSYQPAYLMKNHLITLADYHVWAFEVLYGALLPMGDDQYFADAGLFFRSVHGTLNHLLLADRVWFGRFTDAPYPVASLDAELESDRIELEQAIYAQAGVWETWIGQQSPDGLAGDITYRNLKGAEFHNALTSTLLHVFNHGTHHRGQVSAAVSGFGYDVPEMDLMWYLRTLK